MNKNRIGVVAAVVLSYLLPSALFAHATTIMAVRTPTEIYIGADSRVIAISGDGTELPMDYCKIQQSGAVFFAAGGPFGVRGLLDVRSVLIEAQAAGGTLTEIVNRFSTGYASALRKTLESLRYASTALFQKLTTDAIHLYFVGFEGETPILLHKQFIPRTTKAGSTAIETNHSDCDQSCGGSIVVSFIGHDGALNNFSVDSLQTQPPVEVIRERIGLSINNEPTKSGPPIDILHLTKAGAKWIQNEKNCPAIQAY